MFSYPFHIRDYLTKTRHLSLLEDLAYRRLIDAYYTHEQPLPADVQACARLIAMREHATEVESVLREFFVLTDAGWTNARCDQEIAAFQSFRDAGKRGAEKRWGINREANSPPNSPPTGEASSPPNAGLIATNNQQPTTNTKPKTTSAWFDWEAQDWVGVDSLVPAWQDAYPGIDIQIELRKAKAWVLANPAKAKSRKDWPRFLNNWMSRNGAESSRVPLVGAKPALSNPFEGLA
jgi:uncharacterized protein YdaU (DUF1376 family)